MNKYKIKVYLNCGCRTFKIWSSRDRDEIRKQIQKYIARNQSISFIDIRERNRIFNTDYIREVIVLPISAKDNRNNKKCECGKTCRKIRKNRIGVNLVPFCGKLSCGSYDKEGMNKINEYYSGLPLEEKIDR